MIMFAPYRALIVAVSKKRESIPGKSALSKKLVRDAELRRLNFRSGGT